MNANKNGYRLGVSREAAESAERVMESVKTGKIRKHLLGNTSPIRYGAMEKKEMTGYVDFVKTKLCYDIMSLKGDTGQ